MQKAERITTKLCPNIINIDRNLIERIKEYIMFTNDLSYKVIKKVIDKTIYIVNEIIDNIRLIYVSIKINYLKKR